LDFAVFGMGGDRNLLPGDGYYTDLVDTDRDGTHEMSPLILSSLLPH
jgi:hypothetical protein